MSPWQRRALPLHAGREEDLQPPFPNGRGRRMCRIVRFASAVTKNKLGGDGEGAEMVRITKTAVRSLLEERSPLPGDCQAARAAARLLPGSRRPLR